jgi:hypothetical protein
VLPIFDITSFVPPIAFPLRSIHTNEYHTDNLRNITANMSDDEEMVTMPFKFVTGAYTIWQQR